MLLRVSGKGKGSPSAPVALLRTTYPPWLLPLEEDLGIGGFIRRGVDPALVSP